MNKINSVAEIRLPWLGEKNKFSSSSTNQCLFSTLNFQVRHHELSSYNEWMKILIPCALEPYFLDRHLIPNT